MTPISLRTSSRAGFTLLELILALSLMAVVTGLIVWGIQTHVRALDARRDYAEEAQLAHAILSQIAEDLQSIPERTPIDLSSVEQMMGGVDAESALGALESGGEAPEDLGSLEEMLDDSESNPNTSDIADAEQLPEEPGIYGNQYELQLDVARIPRIDEYQPVAPGMPGSIRDIPSDIKSVAYYVRADLTGRLSASLSTQNSLSGQSTTGLIRRSLSRAVTQWAGQSGNLMSLQQFEQVWASEVLAIEFHYFDGTDWLYEWDSAEQGLPLAVEIMLTMQPRQARQVAQQTQRPGASSPQGIPRIYRTIVRLPQAKAAAGGDESSEMEALGL